MTTKLRYAKFVTLLGLTLALLYAITSSGAALRGDLTPAMERKPLPELTLTDLDGKPWRLADHRGEVVLLNFWASWCPPCREETPGLVRLSKAHKGDAFSIIGVSLDEGGSVRDFVSQFRIPYTIAIPQGDSPLLASVQGLPTTLLIDRQGRLAKSYLGAESENTFRTDVYALIHEPEVTR
jgi:thiol-disulfide isomerase/thioredoxin